MTRVRLGGGCSRPRRQGCRAHLSAGLDHSSPTATSAPPRRRWHLHDLDGGHWAPDPPDTDEAVNVMIGLLAREIDDTVADWLASGSSSPTTPQPDSIGTELDHGGGDAPRRKRNRSCAADRTCRPRTSDAGRNATDHLSAESGRAGVIRALLGRDTPCDPTTRRRVVMAGARWFEVEWSCTRDYGRPVEHYRVVGAGRRNRNLRRGKAAGWRWIAVSARVGLPGGIRP